MLTSSTIWGQNNTVNIKFNIVTPPIDAAEITVFRFYISDVILHNSTGKSYKEKFSYHLIDIDEENSQLITIDSIPLNSIESIHYAIGTDSMINVSGALDGDLDPIKGMYWAWNSGYINFKLEGLKFIDGEQHPFEFHIGGYSGENATVRYRKHDIDQGKKVEINIDVKLNDFMQQIDLKKNASLLIPGKEAAELANIYKHIFTLGE
jgi:hypothetical protein